MKNLTVSLLLAFFLGACSASHEDHNSLQASGGTDQMAVSQFSTECGPMNAQACAAFKSVNQERENQGVAPLKASLNCILAAQFHAQDMYENNYFSHNGLSESWSERMQRFGVKGAMAENIGNASTPRAAVSLWMKSNAHRTNILNGRYKYSGMGYSNGYWVQCFSSNP